MTNTDTADAGRDRDPGRPAGPRRLAARPGHGQHRGGGRGRARRWSARSAASASTCRSSATSTTTATSCWWSTRRRPRALAKYRINPGNVGAKRHDEHFATIVEVAIDNDKPVRIGVNWGSLDQAILTELMDANARLGRAARRPRRDDRGDARVARCARPSWPRRPGCGHDRIILSAKVSGVRDLVDVYRLLAARCDYPLHLGLTEAGMGDKGDRRLDGRARDPAQRGDRRHDPRLADARSRARRANARSRSPSRSSSRWACARSCRRSAPARAAAGRRRRSSRRWPSRSRPT